MAIQPKGLVLLVIYLFISTPISEEIEITELLIHTSKMSQNMYLRPKK